MHLIQSSTSTGQPQSTASVTSQALPRTNEKSQILAKKGFLTARNLTSSIALLVYSEEFQLGVLLHLPSLALPGKPGDTHEGDAFSKPALSMILAEFEALGVAKTDLLTYAIGGSAMDGTPETASTLVRRMLWSHGLVLSACDLGGNQIRSIWMDVENGRTIIRSHPIPKSSAQGVDPLSVAS